LRAKHLPESLLESKDGVENGSDGESKET
jgi:hypothetical protein